MKAFIATAETQGRRNNDFCWAEEGELLTFGSECDAEGIDGPCGCRRSMCGLRSARATTTLRVVDRPDLDLRSLTQLFADAIVRRGFFENLEEAWKPAGLEARAILESAAPFEVGAIVERRGRRFLERPRRPR